MEIYTDGAASNNQNAGTRQGGWAYVLLSDPARAGHGYEAGATNNQMELMAVGMAVKAASRLGITGEVTVHTDSEYVIGAFSGNKVKANAELIFGIRAEADRLGLYLKFQHVRGHAGHPLNELCDRLAREAVRLKPQGPVEHSLPEWAALLGP